MMYKIMIGEISKRYNENWDNNTSIDNMLEPIIVEKDCDIGTLPMAARLFHNEIQIDWGIFAWKAFKSDIKQFFRKKGISEKELDSFDPYKEYGVVYIDN